jgi:hypothetical protein
VTASSPGWRPIQRPSHPGLNNPTLAATPFTWLARIQAASAVGDGLITAALAGSIFFNISPDAARARVAAALIVTVAPFAVITPLIGPAIDRAKGGRRSMMVAVNLGRAFVALLMIGHIKTLLLFPEALAMLVLKSGASIATRAVVPKLVDSDRQLVEANSKLALISALGNISGVAVGGAANFIIGPGFVSSLAMLAFATAGVMSFRLPRIAIATEPATEKERAELSSIGIALAGSAMGVVRGLVGFLSFLLAFELRGGSEGLDLEGKGSAAGAAAALAQRANIVGNPGAPKWHFGAVLIVAGLGGLVGSRVAPVLRTRWLEERILQAVLVTMVLAAAFAAWNGELRGMLALTLAIGMGAATGKLAFDSLVQRDAPDANWGRSFARFEMRFQMAWVVGALVPTLLNVPVRLGYTVVALAAATAIATYVVGLRSEPGVTLLKRVRSAARPVRERRRRRAGRDDAPPTPPQPPPPLPLDAPDARTVEGDVGAPSAAHQTTAVTPVVTPPPPPERRWSTRRPPRRARRSQSADDQLELFE